MILEVNETTCFTLTNANQNQMVSIFNKLLTIIVIIINYNYTGGYIDQIHTIWWEDYDKLQNHDSYTQW